MAEPDDDPRELPEGQRPRSVLLAVPNHHQTMDGGKWDPPLFDPDNTYVAYMPNQHGEQMVYVHRRGESDGELFHGDNAWHGVPVQEGISAGLNLDEQERMFVWAAWTAACRGAW